MFSKQTLLALAISACSVNAGFSTTNWNTNRQNTSDSLIVCLETTFQVPPLPSSEGVFLWPGMYSLDDQLVQTIIVDDPQYRCRKDPNQRGWCVQSYQFSASASDQGIGPSHPVNPGDLLEIKYWWADGKTFQHTANVRTGKTLSDFSWPGGPGYTLSDSVECHQNVAWIPEHSYYNTTIHLDREDPTFDQGSLATNSWFQNFWSPDGGWTWNIEKVTLGATGCRCDVMGSC